MTQITVTISVPDGFLEAAAWYGTALDPGQVARIAARKYMLDVIALHEFIKLERGE